MTKFIALLSFVMAVPAFAHIEWGTARVVGIEVLETNPVTYSVSYEARCEDLEAQVIKVVTQQEVVLGVAVKTDSHVTCAVDQPLVTVKKLRLLGATSDPATVSVLK